MKVMVDEGVPRPLVPALQKLGIEATRFPRQWFGTRNGQLITMLEGLGFSALLTNDKNIASQQSIAGRKLAIVALPHNRQPDIVRRAGDIANTILRTQPGQHVLMGWDGSRTVIEVVAGLTIRTSMPPVARFTLDRR
jgi:hypothetical protein